VKPVGWRGGSLTMYFCRFAPDPTGRQRYDLEIA
jgi:hypothetical protein